MGVPVNRTNLKSASLLAVVCAACVNPGAQFQGTVAPVTETASDAGPDADAGLDASVFDGGVDAGLQCPPRHHEEDGGCVQRFGWVPMPGLPSEEARDHHMSFAFTTDSGSFVALAGGMSDGTMFDSVFVSKVVDAGLSAWVMQSTPMPGALAGGTVAVVGGRVFALGGIDENSGLSLATYSAPLNSDGTIGPWRTERLLAGSPRYHHSSAVLGDSIVVSGGFDSQSIFGETFMAQVDADGGLGPWSQVESPGQRSHHALVQHDGALFSVGGFDGTGQGVLNVTVSRRSEDGGLLPWADAGSDLPSRHRTHSVSVFRDALYLVVGENGNAFTLGAPYTGTMHAPLLPDGGLGAWVDDMLPPSDPRRHTHQSPVVGDTLFSCLGSNVMKATVSTCSALTWY